MHLFRHTLHKWLSLGTALILPNSPVQAISEAHPVILEETSGYPAVLANESDPQLVARALKCRSTAGITARARLHEPCQRLARDVQERDAKCSVGEQAELLRAPVLLPSLLLREPLA